MFSFFKPKAPVVVPTSVPTVLTLDHHDITDYDLTELHPTVLQYLKDCQHTLIPPTTAQHAFDMITYQVEEKLGLDMIDQEDWTTEQRAGFNAYRELQFVSHMYESETELNARRERRKQGTGRHEELIATIRRGQTAANAMDLAKRHPFLAGFLGSAALAKFKDL